MKIVSIATLSPAACGYAEIRGGHLPVHGISSVKLTELSRKYFELSAVVISLFSGGKPSGVEIVKNVVQHAPDAIPEILSIVLQCDLAAVETANLSIGETVEIMTVAFSQTFPESDTKKLLARFPALAAVASGETAEAPSNSSKTPFSTQSQI